MGVESAVNIADLRRLARRYLPSAVFGILDGASEDERALALNIARFRDHSLVPRALAGGGSADQSIVLFGRTYASGFGIAPTGFVSALRRDIELMLADAAKHFNIPMILSGASAHSIETVAARAPGLVWSQLYAAKDEAINADMVRRADAAGVSVLVWTIDAPAMPKNDRQMRDGLGIPPRPTLANRLEALLHPLWMREYLSGGMQRLDSWSPYIPARSPEFSAHRLFVAQRFEALEWRTLETLRKLWTGPLVVKGVLHPDDARRIADMGADGLIVSNHGGMGLDRAPATIDMLPAIAAAVGDRLTVMFDGGVRRGSDIVTARCLGARAAFTGRATLYGAAAGGYEGARRAVAILMDEVGRTMKQIGCLRETDFAPDRVRRETTSAPPAPFPF